MPVPIETAPDRARSGPPPGSDLGLSTAGLLSRPAAVPGPPGCRGCDEDPVGRRFTSTSALPDARSWSTRLAHATVEVLGGARPLSQLRRWTSDEVYAQLSRTGRRGGPVGDPRAGRIRPARVVVRAVRVCEVADGIVEACAVVDDGRRARAFAFRLEGTDGRWRCTRLAAP
jgi:hypothetical protein